MRKYKSKKLSSLLALLTVCFLIVSTIPVSAENNKTLDGVETAEYSESYLQYLEDVKNGDTAKYNGVIPVPHEMEGTVLQNKGRSSLPSSYKASASYNPMNLGLTTPAKNQGDLNTCWAFSSMSTLESYLKLKGYGTYDLSEEHFRWWSTGGTYGWNLDDMSGSSNVTAIGYLTAWAGPKLDKDIPYNLKSEEQGATRPSNMDTAPTQFNVTDVIRLGKDKETVKNAIMQYGSVTSGYAHYSNYFNDDETAYNCTNKRAPLNHSVAIVGWDDNYSKDNFASDVKPESNGAWLVKSSWGEFNSMKGFFWISYEDKTLLTDTDNYAMKSVSKPDSDKKMYQLEYAGLSKIMSNKITAANVFDFSRDSEKLDSVMFETDSVGAKYEVYYAPVVNGVPQNNSMTKLANGTVSYSGYINVPTNSYNLPKGKGAIVVVIDNTANPNKEKSTLAYETNIDAYYLYEAKANLGESYILQNNKFEDINTYSEFSPCNFVIKAITKTSSGQATSGESLTGADRYETAVKVSQKGWTSSQNAVLVNGNAIVDALTATPFTAAIDSPILLTGKDNLDSKTKAELQRLGTKKVYLIGGENSLSKNIQTQLSNMGISIERISGSDRYKTSISLAQKLNSIKSVSQVAVANGVNGLADAISVGAAAADNNMPIILTNEKSELQGADEFLNSSKITKSYIIGGTATLSSNLESKLSNPTRLAGSNRNETNAKIIDKFYTNSDLKYAFVVKDGSKSQGDLIDGLAVGALGAKTDSPVVLVGNKLDESQKTVLKSKKIETPIRVGGNGNESAFNELNTLLEK